MQDIYSGVAMYRIEELTQDEKEEMMNLVDFTSIQEILTQHGKEKANGKEPIENLFRGITSMLQNEYLSDEMPEDLEKFVKKILYTATLCERKFGKRIIKMNIDLKKAENSMVMFYRLHTLCMAFADLPEMIPA